MWQNLNMSKYAKLLMSVFCILFFSCSENRKKIEESLDNMKNRNVVIPFDKLVCYGNTSDDTIYSSQYRLIVYSDTNECSFCNVKNTLYWESLLDSVNDKKSDTKMDIIFIYSPSKEEKERFLANIKMVKLKWPVYVDTCSYFTVANPYIPNNSMFHTFLVNEENRIMLVGNPLYNEKVERMILKVIKEL